jgi:hypothetical protein
VKSGETPISRVEVIESRVIIVTVRMDVAKNGLSSAEQIQRLPVF